MKNFRLFDTVGWVFNNPVPVIVYYPIERVTTVGQPISDGQGVVLIDEIDLHPNWQRKVISKLRIIFPNIQWGITTHSPQVLMNVKHENVKVLRNSKIEESPFVEGRDANALSTDVFGLTKRLPYYEQLLDNIYNWIVIAIESLKQKWGDAATDLHRTESFLESL